MRLNASSIMKTEHHYATVSEAIKKLELDGYTMDLNLEGHCMVRHPAQFEDVEFEIVRIYRYEGDSDPADEATVYGVKSTSGMRGILVTGYGIYTDSISTAILDRLARTKG